MVSDDKIQEYVDGRLSERDRAIVAAYLISNPHKASEVEKDRLLDDILRGLNQKVLDEPVPERLLAPLRDARERAKT